MIIIIFVKNYIFFKQNHKQNGIILDMLKTKSYFSLPFSSIPLRLPNALKNENHSITFHSFIIYQFHFISFMNYYT